MTFFYPLWLPRYGISRNFPNLTHKRQAQSWLVLISKTRDIELMKEMYKHTLRFGKRSALGNLALTVLRKADGLDGDKPSSIARCERRK